MSRHNRKRRQNLKAILDAHRLDEDKRIELIGKNGLVTPNGTAFIVELVEEPGGREGAKGDRYLEKIRALFPQLVVKFRSRGPAPGVESIGVIKPAGDN